MRHRRRRRIWMLRAMRLVKRPLRVLTRTTAALWDSIPAVGPLIVWSGRVAALDRLPPELDGAALVGLPDLPFHWLRDLLRWRRRPAAGGEASAAALQGVVDRLKAQGAVDLLDTRAARPTLWRQAIDPACAGGVTFSPLTGIPVLAVGPGNFMCGPAGLACRRVDRDPVRLIPADRAGDRGSSLRAERSRSPRGAVMHFYWRVALRAARHAAVLPVHLRTGPPRLAHARDYPVSFPDAPRSPPAPWPVDSV